MPYDAFTIDTNAIIQGGLDFEAGLLAQLYQFKDGPTDFIVSEIVVRETLKHLHASAKKARDTAVGALKRSLKSLSQRGLIRHITNGNMSPSCTAGSRARHTIGRAAESRPPS